MSNQYDLSIVPNYTKRKMFLDGTVTIQRFEDVAYKKLQDMEKTARGFFWNPEEVDLSKDATDFKTVSDSIKHIFTSNILRQTALDSMQGRAPSQIFTPVISVPELETVVNNWSFFETNLHSVSYSHIIRNIYNVPKDVFNTIHDTQEIIDMAASVGKYYNALHVLNCKKEVGVDVSEDEHIKAIWLALHASYALEALRFMVSFATSFAMAELKVFIGNSKIVELILHDELLHKGWTAYLINQNYKDDERFRRIAKECEEEVYQIYDDVIREEKEWAKYLLKKGPVIGLNVQILEDYVDWVAHNSLKDIGIKYRQSYPKNHPIPWMNRYIHTNKKQTALQESESTNYVIGVMTSTIDYTELPTL